MIRELGGEVTLTSELGPGHRPPDPPAADAGDHVRRCSSRPDGLPFAIPLDRVERTLRLADHTVRSVAGRRMLVLRDGVLPLLDAAERARRTRGRRRRRPRRRSSAAGEQRLALAVDQLVGQRELVTRPLPPERRRPAPPSPAAPCCPTATSP